MNFKSRTIRIITIIGTAAALAWTGLTISPAPTSAAATATAASVANSVIATGNKFLGTPYKFGSPSGVTKTFDCSSFTQYVYKKNGITLPRGSYDQVKKGKYVSKSNLKKGDLVFFYTGTKGKVSHVAIYAGNGKILHATKSGGVSYSELNSGYWSSRYITARRVIN